MISKWKPSFVQFQENQSFIAVQRTIDSIAFFFFCTTEKKRSLIHCEHNSFKKCESEAKDCTGRVIGGGFLRKLCIWGLTLNCTN